MFSDLGKPGSCAPETSPKGVSVLNFRGQRALARCQARQDNGSGETRRVEENDDRGQSIAWRFDMQALCLLAMACMNVLVCVFLQSCM